MGPCVCITQNGNQNVKMGLQSPRRDSKRDVSSNSYKLLEMSRTKLLKGEANRNPSDVLRDQIESHYGQTLNEIVVVGVKNQLENYSTAEMKAVSQILRNDLYVHKPAANHAKIDQAIQLMRRLNDLNWQYIYKKKEALIGGDDIVCALNDWDCIVIQALEQAGQGGAEDAIRGLYLPSSQVSVNLDKKTVSNAKIKDKSLIKVQGNDRMARMRPESIGQIDRLEMCALTIQTVENNKPFMINYQKHTFGNLWCKEVLKKSHQENDAFPSPRQMLHGLRDWLVLQAREKMGEEGQPESQELQDTIKAFGIAMD